MNLDKPIAVNGRNMQPLRGRIFIAVAGAFSLLGDGSAVSAVAENVATAPPAVRVVQAPAGCFVPDVIMDAKGMLHMVYALNRNAYYVRSDD